MIAALLLLAAAAAYAVSAYRRERGARAVAHASEYTALAAAASCGDPVAIAELRRRGWVPLW